MPIQNIPLPIETPMMDSTPASTSLKQGTFSRLVGVDGRVSGGLKNLYGMREEVDLDDVSGMGGIDTYDGPSFVKAVTFQKRATSTIYRGFVVRWDSQNDNANEQVDLLYTDDNGSTWSRLAIWAAGNTVTSSLDMDCEVDGHFLFVCVDTKSPKTIYWNGSALVAVDMGPGDFDEELTTLSDSELTYTRQRDDDYYLRGNGRYQVAYRFYDSIRGIYSSLSEALTVDIDVPDTPRAEGTITFNVAGGDSGLMQEGDSLTIGKRVYRAGYEKLLLQFKEEEGSFKTTDSSLNNYTVSMYSEASVSTSERKWGSGSLLLEGSPQSISVENSDDWNILSDASNWTIDMWVKHADHVGTESYMSYRSSILNFWDLYHEHGTGIIFEAKSGGATVIICTAAGAEITDTNWHHVALCKVGTEYGIYLDGTLFGFVDDASTVDISAVFLAIGGTGGAEFFDGNMDEIRVMNYNAFSAAPDVGLTDTITIPTGEVSTDISIDLSEVTTISQQMTLLHSTINDDSESTVYVKITDYNILSLSSKIWGSQGNQILLAKSETGANTDDIVLSGSSLTGGIDGGEAKNVKAVLYFPGNTDVLDTFDFDDFDALFDKVDVFRSINMADVISTEGALLYLEQTLDIPATSATWDDLQVTIGTKLDESLPFQTFYNPQKDIVTAPPQSGSIGRYQKITFMGNTASDEDPYDTLHSSLEHASGEYFTTFNHWNAKPDEGKPLQYIPAGDALFILNTNSITHVYKTTDTKPLRFAKLYEDRGLDGKYAAHKVGNSIVMLSGGDLIILSASDGSLGQVSSMDRVLSENWTDLSTVKSGYDSLLNASFFLYPARNEMMVIWHSHKTINMIEGANFVDVTSGPDISTGEKTRAYFTTATGLIVKFDEDASGNGNMWDLSSSYTLDGDVTAGGTTLIDSDATYHADMVGALCYLCSSDNAGTARTISAVDVGAKKLTFSSNFTSTIAVGDRYSISPVPFSAKFWPLQIPDVVSRFSRWNTVGVTIKTDSISGLSTNPNASYRVGMYRNGKKTLEADTVDVSVDENPADSVGALRLDGIDLESYVEQIATGRKFELTNLEVSVTMGNSKNVE